jgi:hypothetical protein
MPSNLLELKNSAVSSVYNMAGDDKERRVYNIGIYIYIWLGLSDQQIMTKVEIPNS